MKPVSFRSVLLLAIVVVCTLGASTLAPPPSHPPPVGDVVQVDVATTTGGTVYLATAGDADPAVKPGSFVQYNAPAAGQTLRLTYPFGWPFQGPPDGTDGDGMEYFEVSDTTRTQKLRRTVNSACLETSEGVVSVVPNCIEYLARLSDPSDGVVVPVGGPEERTRPRIIIDRD